MANISAVIIAKNEEGNIINCLKSIAFCDEIILIDDFSTDRTVEYAKRFTKNIYTREMNGDFSAQRNFGLAKTTSDWILFLDADEVVPKTLGLEIVKAIKNKNNHKSGYFFKRTDYLWGQRVSHGEVGSVRLLRLARKRSGKWQRAVHEFWHIIGEIGEFDTAIDHYPHPSVYNFLDELNIRSTLHAQENRKEGKKSTVLKIIFLPLLKFINGWIIKLGFLDGMVGFLIAMIMSFHSFMSWSKLWLIQKQK